MPECDFCGKVYTSRGFLFHRRYCRKNPDRDSTLRKSQAWLDAMSQRKGQSINQYKDVDWSSVPFDILTFSKKRQRLLEESKFSCTLCGFSTRRPCGGSILEIDHLDGDHTNNTRENLRVLCPNCHALTPNFRNWGRTSTKKTSKRVRKGNKDFKCKVD